MVRQCPSRRHHVGRRDRLEPARLPRLRDASRHHLQRLPRRGGEKTALVDTVKAPFVPELLARIARRHRPADDRLHRRQPRRARPQQRAARGHGGDARTRKVVASQARGGAASPSTTTGSRSARSAPDDVDRPRRQDAAVHADADGPLARLDVHLLPRGPHAACPTTRSGSTSRPRERFADEVGHGPRASSSSASTTRTSSCRSASRSPRPSRRSSRPAGMCDIDRAVARRHLARRRRSPTPSTHYAPLDLGRDAAKVVVAYATMWGSTDDARRADRRRHRRGGRRRRTIPLHVPLKMLPCGSM